MKGLDQVPRDEWPPVVVTHVAFQIMVGCGFALLGLVGLGLLLRWRRGAEGWLTHRRFLQACVAAAPLGLIAVEAGGCVTEVGRQPWVVRGVLKTSEAVTPMPDLQVPLITFTVLYLVLGVVVVVLLRALFRETTPDPAAPAEEGAR